MIPFQAKLPRRSTMSSTLMLLLLCCTFAARCDARITVEHVVAVERLVRQYAQLLGDQLSFRPALRGVHHHMQAQQSQTPQIPTDCNPIVQAVQAMAAPGTGGNTSGAPTIPKAQTLCDLWDPLQKCYAAIQNTPLKDSVPAGVIEAVKPLKDALCGTQEGGKACTTVADAIVQAASCTSTAPPNCPPTYCAAPPAGGSSSTCQPALNSALLENVCHGCLLGIVKAVITTALNVQRLDLSKSGLSTDSLMPMDVNVMMAMLQTLRDTVCATVPSGDRCLVKLGIVTASGTSAQAQSMLFGGTATDPNAAIPDFQSTIISKVCSDADSQVCFGKIVAGAFSVSTMSARSTFSTCTKQAGSSAQAKAACSAALQGEQQSLAAGSWQASMMCMKNSGGALCMGLPDTAKNAAGSQWPQCAPLIFSSNTMPDSCVSYLTSTVNSWGCCQKFIFALAVDNNANNAFNPKMKPMLAAMPPMCEIHWAAPIKKSLKLNVPFAKLQANQTLYWQTINSSRMDVANRIGVSPDNIVNATLTSTSTLGRFFSVLQSTGSSNFNFAIQTPDAAVAQSAATNFDTDVARGTMYLPSTSLALQQDGVLPSGQTAGNDVLAPTAAAAPPSTTTAATAPTPPATTGAAAPTTTTAAAPGAAATTTTTTTAAAGAVNTTTADSSSVSTVGIVISCVVGVAIVGAVYAASYFMKKKNDEKLAATAVVHKTTVGGPPLAVAPASDPQRLACPLLATPAAPIR